MNLGEDLSQTIVAEAMYAGELAFARRRYSRDLDGAEIAVVGIPFDQGTTNRPGARFGPRAIREQSSLVTCFPWGLWPWEFDVFERHRVIDYSDITFPPASLERMIEVVEHHVGRIVNAGVSVLSLGGDHTTTLPVLRAHAAQHGALSLVHCDAHSDTWAVGGDDLNHGSVFFRAVQEGLIDPARSIQIGMRTPNPDTHGFTVIDVDRLLDDGPRAIAAVVRDVVGDHPAYLSFDVDFLDPAYAPGTGTPVVGGPTTRQARTLLRNLAGLRLCGADVVEVAPAYDGPGQITALAAATIACDLLHLLALGR